MMLEFIRWVCMQHGVLLVFLLFLGLGTIAAGAWAFKEACEEAEKKRKELKRRRALSIDHLRGTVKLILEDESLTAGGKVRELVMAINEACYSLRRQP